MNEAEWAEASPYELLRHLHGKITPRKVRQVACACVRQALPRRTPSASDSLRLAELFADGQASEHQLASARYGGRFLPGHPAWAVCWPPNEDPFDMVYRAMAWASGFGGATPNWPGWSDLIRDVVGNPFRPHPVDPAWLAWNGGTVAQVARAIYDERSFDQLPILGDALEEAGCDDAVMLNHCRGGGVHAVGCWLLDALLRL